MTTISDHKLALEALANAMLDDAALEALSRAYDMEDSAQRGEPDPWFVAREADPDEDEWRYERLACAKAGLEALAAYWAAIERKAAP